MKPLIRRRIPIVKAAFLVLCIFCLLFSLLGCFSAPSSYWKRPSKRYREGVKQGLYPTEKEFPNTEWACRDLDLVIDLFENNKTITGTYSINGKSYRAVGYFDREYLMLDFFLKTETTVSEKDPLLVTCNRICSGRLTAYYCYSKDTGTITCTEIQLLKSVDMEEFPESLTFEQAGAIAQTTERRWVADELDFYLDSFSDITGFFRGEIVIDGKKRFIQAYEIGNGHYFELFVEDDDYGHLIDLSFEMENNQIIATIVDEHKLLYNNWCNRFQDLKKITLKPVSVE